MDSNLAYATISASDAALDSSDGIHRGAVIEINNKRAVVSGVSSQTQLNWVTQNRIGQSFHANDDISGETGDYKLKVILRKEVNWALQDSDEVGFSLPQVSHDTEAGYQARRVKSNVHRQPVTIDLLFDHYQAGSGIGLEEFTEFVHLTTGQAFRWIAETTVFEKNWPQRCFWADQPVQHRRLPNPSGNPLTSGSTQPYVVTCNFLVELWNADTPGDWYVK